MVSLKVYCKNRVLILNIFPLKDFRIDGYIKKTGICTKDSIDLKQENGLFYISESLLSVGYTWNYDENLYYDYLENKDLIEIEIPDEYCKDKLKIQQFILSQMIKIVGSLRKKFQLLTNLDIILPKFQIYVFDENNNMIIKYPIGYVKNENNILKVRTNIDGMKDFFVERLSLEPHLTNLPQLVNKNIRLERALSFYHNSFLPDQLGVRFTMLFSALESLFNIDKEDIQATISKYTSKIFFLNNTKTKKLRKQVFDFYDLRSYYVHGNEVTFSSNSEFQLRELVRSVLMIYMKISDLYNIHDADKIKEIIEQYKRNDLIEEMIAYLQNFEKTILV